MSNKSIKSEFNIEALISALPELEINQEHVNQTISSVKLAARNNKQREENAISGHQFAKLFKTRFIYAVASFSIGIILTASVFSSSANALPGHWLYPIKLISEKVAFALKMTPSGKAELSITFSEERLDEILKTYEMKGKVDKEILELLLIEANKALSLSKQTDTETSNKLNSKISELNKKQVAVLAKLENNSSGEEKELYRYYGSRCQGLMSEGPHNMMMRY